MSILSSPYEVHAICYDCKVPIIIPSTGGAKLRQFVWRQIAWRWVWVCPHCAGTIPKDNIINKVMVV